MIKLLGSNPWHGNAISGVFRTLFYSTEALASCSPPFETLYHRISRAGNPRISIVPVLDQWIEEGRDVNKSELQSFIKMLRKYRRYSHALQVRRNNNFFLFLLYTIFMYDLFYRKYSQCEMESILA